jgi:hypothetical protein
MLAWVGHAHFPHLFPQPDSDIEMDTIAEKPHRMGMWRGLIPKASTKRASLVLCTGAVLQFVACPRFHHVAPRHEQCMKWDWVRTSLLSNTAVLCLNDAAQRNRGCSHPCLGRNVAVDSQIEAVGEQSPTYIRHRHSMSQELDITVQGTARPTVR